LVASEIDEDEVELGLDIDDSAFDDRGRSNRVRAGGLWSGCRRRGGLELPDGRPEALNLLGVADRRVLELGEPLRELAVLGAELIDLLLEIVRRLLPGKREEQGGERGHNVLLRRAGIIDATSG